MGMGTGEQLSIFGGSMRALVDVDTSRTMTLQDRFDAFHRANPHVYDAIVKLSRTAKSRGTERYSMARVFEVLRWSSLDTTGSEWKLNNSYRAFYARMVMERESGLSGFFETRIQRGKVA